MKLDQHLLPAGMRGECAGVVYGRDSGCAGGSVAEFGEVFAGHFDVAAKQGCGDAIIRLTNLYAKETRRKADGKPLDADPAELGDGKVAKLVN